METMSHLKSVVYEMYVRLRYEDWDNHEPLISSDKRKFLKRINDIKLMVLRAQNQLIGRNALDKDTEIMIRDGIRPLQFLIYQITASRQQGMYDYPYLCKLAKDVLQDFPSIPDSKREGPCLVQVVEINDIANLLRLQDSNSAPVQVVPIFGMTDTGKTSLSHLVYFDSKVQWHFDIKIWVNLTRIRNPNNILEKVVEKLDFDEGTFGGLVFEDKKYLLILEDLSNDEVGLNWFSLLESLLMASSRCKPGSKILVTSMYPSVQPDVLFHLPMLKGAPFFLSIPPNESLALFQSKAFGGIAEENRNPLMIGISLEIFDKYVIDPMNITTLASMLSSDPTDLEKWLFINDILLPSVENPVESIESATEFVQGVDAFARPLLYYSSLFPFDHEFTKEELYDLWKVQEFLDAMPSSEATFNECFEKLLKWGYFVKDGKPGLIVSYKVPLLMHEVVKHLASEEYCLLEKPTKKVNYLVLQHVSFIVDSSWKAPSWLPNAGHLKSLLFLPKKSSYGLITIPGIDKILAHLKALQALDLAIVNCSKHLIFLNELNNLRYLRLGISYESLPECVTNLQLMQTLDLHKFPQMRHLCFGDKLIDPIPKFGGSTELQVVDSSFNHPVAGKLKVNYQKDRKESDDLSVEWSSSDAETSAAAHKKKDDPKSELFLQPPSILESLAVQGWKGVWFPQWMMDKSFVLLSNLVSIHIADCSRFQYLPSFSTLLCLESLQLWGLNALEFVESCTDNSIKPFSPATAYFPSLKQLILVNLPKLKEWYKSDEIDDANSQLQQPIFHCLSELRISGCPMLVSMPLMPTLDSVEASNIQQNLLQKLLKGVSCLRSLKVANMSTPAPLPTGFESLTTLQELSLCWLYNLRALPESIEHFTQLRKLVIRYLPKLEYLPESLGGLSALKHIEIVYCPRLKQVPKSLLKSLQRLEIKECVKLAKRYQVGGDDWELIIGNISDIYVDGLPQRKTPDQISLTPSSVPGPSMG